MPSLSRLTISGFMHQITTHQSLSQSDMLSFFRRFNKNTDITSPRLPDNIKPF
ncbi:unnamed protein product, partial [Tilletia laevis]